MKDVRWDLILIGLGFAILILVLQTGLNRVFDDVTVADVVLRS